MTVKKAINHGLEVPDELSEHAHELEALSAVLETLGPAVGDFITETTGLITAGGNILVGVDAATKVVTMRMTMTIAITPEAVPEAVELLTGMRPTEVEVREETDFDIWEELEKLGGGR